MTFPFVMLLILLVVQFGVWQHAVHVAEATAAEALAATRVYGGSAGAGEGKARSMLSQLGGSVLRSPRISVSRTANIARVAITGGAQPVVPFLTLPVSSVASGPIERFRPEQ